MNNLENVARQALEAMRKYIAKELTVGQRYTNEGQELLDAHVALREALEQPARQPLTYGLIMQMARDAGLELEPTRNRLIEVRGQHAQLLNLARAIEQAHGITGGQHEHS